MAYRISRAGNIMSIPELQYGIGAEIKFTAFTSCLGVMSKVRSEGNIIGVHLALMEGNNYVTAQDVGQVRWLLDRYSYESTSTVIIGAVSVWHNSVPNVLGRLFRDLGLHRNHPRVHAMGDYTWGGKITNNEVEITY